MNRFLIPLILTLLAISPATGDETARLTELDAYWAEVSRAVQTGDFDAYKATCHEEGILVSGNKQTSQPLTKALARWKKDFAATKAGEVKANVEFRFCQRLGDETTAHETGIFAYTAKKPGEKPITEYIHLEALLVKKADGWKILMEHQKSSATKAEWEAMK
jgi:hypothetical protein